MINTLNIFLTNLTHDVHPQKISAVEACENKSKSILHPLLATIINFIHSLQDMSLLLDLPLDIFGVIVDLLDLQSQIKLSETCKALNDLIFIHPRVITVLSYDNSIIKPLLYQQILILSLYSYPKYSIYFKRRQVHDICWNTITVVKVSSRGNAVEQLDNE